jgi:hypothetical protein
MECLEKMASLPIPESTVRTAVEDAVAGLVRVSAWREFAFVNLPIFMPSGAPATVRVRAHHDGFEIDDGGFAYRELEALGYERSFPSEAGKAANAEELQKDRRRIWVVVSSGELTRAVCDVALASRNVVASVYDRMMDADAAEIEDYLQERLFSIFGEEHVRPDEKIKGASTKDWEFSGIVHLDSGLVVFQAVSNQANAINRASTAFHDLRELTQPPQRVAVVKDKAAMGANLSILSQAGRVIQGDQNDDVYRSAVA